MIRAYRLYTGSDGNSHVQAGSIGGGELVQTESIQFKETPPHSSLDWHNDPIPQYVITLAGVLEFTTAGGETFVIYPGDVLLAEDHTGSGHKWRLTNDEPWKRAYVVFKKGADTRFVPELGTKSSGQSRQEMTDLRKEMDSLGEVDVPADKLWGAQTQRSLEHFSIGADLIPREMITAYATLKKGAANANHASGRLDDERRALIVCVCDEILAGRHHDMFPLHVWMTGNGPQFNMNVVISNRCCQIAGTPLGSKTPVHPNDHVNMSQSSNDSFPSAMNIAAAMNVKQRLMPAVARLCDAIAAKSGEWKDVVKIGGTHMQDATPLTLGQEWSGYAGMLADDTERIEDALKGVNRLALGGAAVGTGINSAPGFDTAVAAEIAGLTNLPFVTAPNKFAVQGAHDALVQLSGTLRTLAVSLQNCQ